MKIDVPAQRPGHYEEFWPGVYNLFSHFEFAAGVPSPIFLITTLKENGLPNACLHAWSTFSGDGDGFYAVMPSLMQRTHTYQNILRDGEFCVNFLAPQYYAAGNKTIEENGPDTDELAAAGLHPEAAKLVKPPRIAEAFLSYECKLYSHQDLSGNGLCALVIGRVVHAAVEENSRRADTMCGDKGFYYNIHSPLDPASGKRDASEDSIAVLRLVEPEG